MGVGTFVSAGLNLVGGAQEEEGLNRTGAAARRRGRHQRIFNEVAAGQVVAVGQRTAIEETRQAELMASRAIAVAAAGGITQDIDHLIADIEGEGAYAASLALHAAETEAERLRFEGRQAEEYGLEQEESYRAQGDAAFMRNLGSLFNTVF